MSSANTIPEEEYVKVLPPGTTATDPPASKILWTVSLDAGTPFSQWKRCLSMGHQSTCMGIRTLSRPLQAEKEGDLIVRSGKRAPFACCTASLLIVDCWLTRMSPTGSEIYTVASKVGLKLLKGTKAYNSLYDKIPCLLCLRLTMVVARTLIDFNLAL